MKAVNSQIKEELPQKALQAVSDRVDEIASEVREISSNAIEHSVGFVKKYPVHSTLGALCVGLVVGITASRGFKE